MITWCTMFAYGATAGTLDDRRLGITKDNALEVANWLLEYESEVPDDHPVLKMWTGYEFALCIYGMFLCMEWTMHRRFADDVFWKLRELTEELRAQGEVYVLPPWAQDQDVLRSHRSNLMRRWPDNYAKAWKGTPENMPYLWPCNAFDIKTDEPMGYDLYLSSEDKELVEAGERVLPKRIRGRVVNL